jgi:hypothetical protein
MGLSPCEAIIDESPTKQLPQRKEKGRRLLTKSLNLAWLNGRDHPPPWNPTSLLTWWQVRMPRHPPSRGSWWSGDRNCGHRRTTTSVSDGPRVGTTVGPVGMDTRGFRTRWIWIRVEKLTRRSYRVGYPKYIGSGMGKIFYPRISSGYSKYQYTSLKVLHQLKMCYIH